MPDEILSAAERSLFDIINQRTGEQVGTHEDKLVASDEAERLDSEAAALGQRVRHVVHERKVIATDDPDDGMPNLDGPIVSSENVTRANIRRGKRPDEIRTA